jgi:hypothetical protein
MNNDLWLKHAKPSGWYWMAYEENNGEPRKTIVLLDEKDAKGLYWNGLHYGRSQFKNAHFHGPLVAPALPEPSTLVEGLA